MSVRNLNLNNSSIGNVNNNTNLKSNKSAFNNFFQPNQFTKTLQKKFVNGSGKYSFGTSERIKSNFKDYMNRSVVVNSKDLKSIPGPGDYNPKKETLQRQTSSWSIRGKEKYSPKNLNPGPGAYNLEKTPTKFQKFKFGSAKKEFLFVETIKQKNQIPGPGEYKDKNNFIKNSQVFSFGKDQKLLNKRSLTPGPGQYEKKEIGANGPKFSFNKNFEQRLIADRVSTTKISSKDQPGPGLYNTGFNDSNHASTKKFRLGSAKKEINYDNKIPGPGSYITTVNEKKIKESKLNMGTSVRKTEFLDLKSISPGPAIYNNKSSFGVGNKSYGFGKDQKLKPVKSLVPGPGIYNI